ncbi:hypothetical protein NQ314_007879 [Rhamnusium bicolor]|uniref:Uncharacterized protein n=1 Tax=Rhamnusium bicolor TaxID=1586634 RepID=A0AAV8YI72_9CUCU|nr:hypothetical protein NQ314_007879 [Rhamnusium bicolor]
MGDKDGEQDTAEFLEDIKEAYRGSTQRVENRQGMSYWWNDDIAAKRHECLIKRRRATRMARNERITEEDKLEAKEAYT